VKVRCPACWGDVDLDTNGRIDFHKEQILGARGFVDGYVNCGGGGRKPRLIDQPTPAQPQAGD